MENSLEIKYSKEVKEQVHDATFTALGAIFIGLGFGSWSVGFGTFLIAAALHAHIYRAGKRSPK